MKGPAPSGASVPHSVGRVSIEQRDHRSHLREFEVSRICGSEMDKGSSSNNNNALW